MSGYGAFARYYDALTENVGYKTRAAYFHELICRHRGKASLLLDLACGTGSLSAELAALGYEVIGVDASQEMLAQAMQKQPDVLYLCQRMDKLDLYGTVEATVCALDSLNHLPDEAALRRVFARVGLFTEPGGLFLFDVNTPYKHREVLGMHTFVYDLPQVYCVWQNTYHTENDRVDIVLDFFERCGAGLYARAGESFSERTFSHELLCRALEENGFALLQVYAGDTFSPAQKDTQRLVYIARKNEG